MGISLLPALLETGQTELATRLFSVMIEIACADGSPGIIEMRLLRIYQNLHGISDETLENGCQVHSGGWAFPDRFS